MAARVARDQRHSRLELLIVHEPNRGEGFRCDGNFSSRPEKRFAMDLCGDTFCFKKALQEVRFSWVLSEKYLSHDAPPRAT